MSLNVFLALCILGVDFMVYAFFQWTFGEKRNAVARRLAGSKSARKEQSRQPFVVVSQGAADGGRIESQQRKGKEAGKELSW